MNIINKKVNKRNWSKINYGKIRQITFLLDKDVILGENERLNAQNKKKTRKTVYIQRQNDRNAY